MGPYHSYPFNEQNEVIVEGEEHEGDLLALVRREEHRLVGKWVPYEGWQERGQCPIAVTGITKYKASVLVGKRGDVSSYSGCWEFAPSGGLTPFYAIGVRVEYRLQLLKELEEEVGIVSTNIESIRPLCLIHDVETPLIEICCEIMVSTDQVLLNGEYTELQWVPIKEIDQLKGEWVPLSKFLHSHPSTLLGSSQTP